MVEVAAIGSRGKHRGPGDDVGARSPRIPVGAGTAGDPECADAPERRSAVGHVADAVVAEPPDVDRSVGELEQTDVVRDPARLRPAQFVVDPGARYGPGGDDWAGA